MLSVAISVSWTFGVNSQQSKMEIFNKDIEIIQKAIVLLQQNLDQKASKTEIAYQKEQLELIIDLLKEMSKRINRLERKFNNYISDKP